MNTVKILKGVGVANPEFFPNDIEKKTYYDIEGNYLYEGNDTFDFVVNVKWDEDGEYILPEEYEIDVTEHGNKFIKSKASGYGLNLVHFDGGPALLVGNDRIKLERVNK